MHKEVAIVLIFALAATSAHSLSIRDLISRYSFSASTSQMNITAYSDYMIDRNNNGINDTLIIELTTSSTNGNFIFAAALFDKVGILTSELNKTLGSGINKLNLTFDSGLLSQQQFNYSIKSYNSSYSLKYRKDGIPTQTYKLYEEGIKILSIKDFTDGKLNVNLTLNSTVNGTFNVTILLSYNNSVIFARENFSITSSVQALALGFDNEAVKRTHYAGNSSISSVKIGRKTIKTNFTTAKYRFSDFAAKSYISGFTDAGIDTDSNNKLDKMQINASLQILNDNDHSIVLSLYDFSGNILEIKNASMPLSSGKRVLEFEVNGSKINGKKLDGPYVIKNAELYENGTLVDKAVNAHTTSYYSFGDFEGVALPDLKTVISVSDGYRYGLADVAVNISFRNIGKKAAFNVFTEVFDNGTLSKTNKSGIISSNSEIRQEFNFTNISDFEVSAFADISGLVEESNESNNADRIVIKLNKRPNLAFIGNITVNETEKIQINLSASDQNEDKIAYSMNLSKFSNNYNAFKWLTTTMDSGTYIINATASDGFLNDSRLFKITVLDLPELDSDNDGINESVDRLVGDEKSINSSTINFTILINNSGNLSRILDNNTLVKFFDGNSTIAEFEFDFSLHKLNLTNMTLNKQAGNTTGSVIVRGLRLPSGTTKALYLDKINNTGGVCIRDEEILAISQISPNCDSGSEFRIECDGTAQNSYTCTYNSTLNKYKVEGLSHSGIMQIDYAKPAPGSGSGSSGGLTGAEGQSPSGSSSSSGGGGGVVCNSDWQCSEWSECAEGLRSRKCLDLSQCAFPSKMPEEREECASGGKSIIMEYIDGIRRAANIFKEPTPAYRKIPKEIKSVTGMAVNEISGKKYSPLIFVLMGAALLAIGYHVISSRKS